MPQAGFTPIQTYNSPTAGHIPVYTDLYAGELAINTTDEKLYFKNTGGTVKLLASTAVFTTTGSGSYVLATSPTITGHPTIEGVTSTGATGTGKFVFDSSPTLSGVTLSDGTANGVVYLNSSKVLTSGSGLVYDSSGNLGLGVVPSAWYTHTKGIQVGQSASFTSRDNSNELDIFLNAYLNSATNYIYITNGVASNYSQASGAHYFYTAPSGTAGNAISFTQAMTLDSSGNLLVGKTSATSNGGNIQTSNGITFPATQVACSDPNTLDDYEEGSFTPTFTGSVTNPTITGGAFTGRYVKIGQTVTVWIQFNTLTYTGGSGELQIESLPFVCSAGVGTGGDGNAGVMGPMHTMIFPGGGAYPLYTPRITDSTAKIKFWYTMTAGSGDGTFSFTDSSLGQFGSLTIIYRTTT